jgi:tetratricopeptide (TPR) repeat protein
LDAYGRAIRLNPYISEVWYDLGTLYESCNNQTSDAIDAYSRALELDPSNAQISTRLSALKQKLINEPNQVSNNDDKLPSLSLELPKLDTGDKEIKSPKPIALKPLIPSTHSLAIPNTSQSMTVPPASSHGLGPLPIPTTRESALTPIHSIPNAFYSNNTNKNQVELNVPTKDNADTTMEKDNINADQQE